MTMTTKGKHRELRVETRSSSRQSNHSGNSSPKLLSPRDRKFKANFPLSPAMGTELERLKQAYTPVEKVVKPEPEERPLIRSFSTVPHRVPGTATVNTKFRSLGGKVTNLLRVRKAFATSKKDEDDIITSNKHLPKEPRFSSSLSPAAQFAMMKGYEDAVYENLCKHYPASKLFLKRSKTPPRGYIDIGNVGKLLQTTIPEDGQNDLGSENALKKLDIAMESRWERKERLTRMKSETHANASKDLLNRRANFQRTKSMPLVVIPSVPREKRLILSHRLQSAMDILDTVRGNVGQNSISPRIHSYPRQIQPVSDFNQWSSIWSNEFKISRTTGKT